MGLRQYLAAVAIVGVGVACSPAAADAPTRKVEPVDPTADAERYDAWNDAVLWNQTVAWNDAAFWHGVEILAVNYQPPPPAPVRQPQGGSSGPSGGTVGGSCGSGWPMGDTVMMNESRGNPTARNPSSGAYGCAQIMPGTWSGTCGDLGSQGGASIDTQKQCAGRIMATQGRGAWTAPG